MSRHYVLAAGGTGGHMIPAHALAEELMRRGHHVALVTDERGARIPGLFERVPVHVLPAGRLAGGPVGWAKAVKNIFTGRAMALRLYETFRPAAGWGFTDSAPPRTWRSRWRGTGASKSTRSHVTHATRSWRESWAPPGWEARPPIRPPS